MALDKDKKDQSKYYLSYSKPPVLDIKWGNRDAIVVERAKIPKFIQLDDIVTPLALLELFFDDVLVDMIVGYTKLYSRREKSDFSFEVTGEKKKSYSEACCCLVGAISYHRHLSGNITKFSEQKLQVYLVKS